MENTFNMKFDIDSRYIGVLDFKLKKLNNKAIKLGLTEVGYNEISRSNRTTSGGKMIPIITIEMFGEVPILDGWMFVGELYAVAENENIVKSISNKITIPNYYRNMVNVCEHCNMKRRRKSTYVVYNKDTEVFKSVGKSCLKDFIPGNNSIEKIANYVSFILPMIKELENGCDSWDNEPRQSIGEPWISVEDALQLTLAEIRANKWVSSKKSYDSHGELVSTKDMILDRVFNKCFFDDMESSKIEMYKITDEDKIKVERVISWVKDLDNNSEYNRNVKLLVKLAQVRVKELGYICSLVKGFYMNVEKAEITAKLLAEDEGTYIGSIKEKIEVDVKVVSIKSINTQWGVSYLHTFKSGKSTLVWFSSNSPVMEVDNTYKIKGTVKSHTVFGITKQTALIRVKVI